MSSQQTTQRFTSVKKAQNAPVLMPTALPVLIGGHFVN